jgi:NADH dehydrogenase
MSQHAPVVMIVGGGFGGLAAAGTLKKEPVKVILFDRTNHHLFQPLLYQVATSVFAPVRSDCLSAPSCAAATIPWLS